MDLKSIELRVSIGCKWLTTGLTVVDVGPYLYLRKHSAPWCWHSGDRFGFVLPLWVGIPIVWNVLSQCLDR